MSTWKPIHQHALLDSILDDHRSQIGDQFEGYRNHCFTVFNLVRHAAELEPAREDTVAIATAFHDIALWTDDRIDYLDPSIVHARAFCEATGRSELADLVAAMISWHHKIFPGPLSSHDPLVRLFRDADWSAFTFGLIPFDRFTAHRRAIAEAFPDAGFHAFLNARAIRHLTEGGWRAPLPMMKL